MARIPASRDFPPLASARLGNREFAPWIVLGVPTESHRLLEKTAGIVCLGSKSFDYSLRERRLEFDDFVVHMSEFINVERGSCLIKISSRIHPLLD